MSSRKCEKTAFRASEPGKKNDTRTPVETVKEQEELFSSLWILGFCILCEILFFAAQDLAQTFLNGIAEALPAHTADLITGYLFVAFSALALLLIFTGGICVYSVWKKELRPLPVKIVSIALFLLGHTAAVLLSDGLAALLLLFTGDLPAFSGNGAEVAGIILSFLLRVASETAIVSWALGQYEKRW